MSALTSCPACGRQIAKDAKACPHCGKRNSYLGPIAKIIIALTVILTLATIVTIVS